MPISAYVGRTGSGKSYGIFENVIVPALKNGREVWTNIPFHEEKIKERFGVVPTFYDYAATKDNDNWFQDVLPKGVVFVADEVYKLWPSGMTANKIPEQHRSFLAEHRHMVGSNGKSTEIILACQDLGQIAAFVRNLVDSTYRSVKLDKVGLSKSFKIEMYDGPVTGPESPKAKLVTTSRGSYKKSIYELYKSHTMSETGSAGDESKMDSRASFLRNKTVYLAPVFFLLAIGSVYFFNSLYQSFFGDEPDANSQVESSVASVTTTRVTATSKQVKATFSTLDVFRDRELSIVFNRGRYPDIDYRIRADDGDSYFVLSRSDMLKLGYQIRPISDCLVSVKVDAKDYIVTCINDESKGLFDFEFGSKDASA